MADDPNQVMEDLGSFIESSLSNELSGYRVALGELTLETSPTHIIGVLRFLKEDASCRFLQLIDICGVDYPERSQRFDVVYHLLSLHQNQRVRVIVPTDESTPVPSCIDLFPVANWFEREAFDMYGILFSSHPDLRRLLTDYGFEGHPLRKDFPLTGHVEVRYDEEAKKVIYEPVKLVQEFRAFDFLSPWEGAKYILPGDEKAEEKKD